jgi:precorrin-6B methylase 2
MAFDELMRKVDELVSDAESVAALGARLRLDERGVTGDPFVRTHVDRVVTVMGADALVAGLDDNQRAVASDFIAASLRHALDLLEDPARPGAWTYTDTTVLQSQGSASALIASLIADAGLGKPDARILDVGAGVGALSIAFCRTFPESTVVGLEPWEPSMTLARENVSVAGLDTRIDLRAETIEEYDDRSGFDLMWLPSPFLRETILGDAIARAYAMARPGAEIVLGAYGGPEAPLSRALADLRTARSGGTPLTPADAMVRLQFGAFADVHEVERTWDAPIRFFVGRRA